MDFDRKLFKASLLLAGVFGFAALGQYYFFYRREYLWDGIAFMALALACFLALIRTLAIAPATPRPLTLPRPRLSVRSLVPGLALVLNFIAARSANASPPPHDFSISAFLWLASLFLFFAAFVPYPRRKSRVLSPGSRVPKNEFALVIALLLLGLLLRVWDLEHIPANLSGDEGTQGLWARDVLAGRLRNPFATGWFTVPTMSYFALAGSLRLFGQSVAGLRAMSALVGSATLIFTYLLARRALGKRVALFGLAALAVSHFHIHFSRLSMNNVADPFFMALTLWFLVEGLAQAEVERREETRLTSPESRTTSWFLAAGLAMGLSWYGYWGSRTIVIVVAVYLGTCALQDKGFLRRHARDLVLMGLMALMAVSPLLLYFGKNPQNFSARFNQVSFFSWLERELTLPNHASTLSLVWRQIWRSISAFNHTLDPTFWYRPQIPLLDFVSGILFILGLVVAVTRWRRSGIRLVLIWFGLALTLGWILTENPPSSMRMVINAPAVALLVALGLDRLLILAHRITGGRREFWTRVGLALLAITAVLNVRYYFFTYTPTRVYGNPTAEIATDLARYLQERSDHPYVYFYGKPRMAYEFGTLPFMASHAAGTSVPPKDPESDYEILVTGPTLFVVLTDRLSELEEIQAQYPDGNRLDFFSEADQRLMFVVYEVSP